MLKRILRNLVGKKNAIPYPLGFNLTPDEHARIVTLKERIDSSFGRSLRIRQVDTGSCNACEWECTALTNPVYDIQRFGMDFVASPRHADVLLVTGPVTKQMELALKKTYLAMPKPKLVIACGDCAIDGGIFKDSYAVNNGVSNLLEVDCQIPGCPPTPSAMIIGILGLVDKLVKK